MSPEQIDQKRIEYGHHGWGQEWALLATALINEQRRASLSEFDIEKHGTTPRQVIFEVLGE